MAIDIDPRFSENPDLEQLRFLEEAVIKFNIQATGIVDGRSFGLFLRDGKSAVIGGISGWTWGKSCFIAYLFIPANVRRLGYGTKLLDAVEAEAVGRGCGQLIVRTHNFQAPHFYTKFGFAVVSQIPNFPYGHEEFTMIKHLTGSKASV